MIRMADPETLLAKPSSNNDGTTNSNSVAPHRVKKLLETYMDTAGRSLTGPVDHPLITAKKLASSVSSLIDVNPPPSAVYKLPPDVELSKNIDDDPSNDPSPPTGGGSTTFNNGLVTLSRINDTDDLSVLGLGSSSRRMNRSRSERHLSGEMIRRILEQQKASERAAEHRMTKDNIPIIPQTPPTPQTSGGNPFKIPPVMTERDRGFVQLQETDLWAERIACFNIGGEDRLCLPQILNSVLRDVTLIAINQACDELQIFCSTCTAQQLEMLKAAKVIPVTASQCGLITKSDAERVCSVLLDRNPPRASMSGFHAAKSSPFSFKVQHECFGRSYGLVLPEAYTKPDSRCIECLECEGLFSPQKFVCHAHHSLETNQICHWGFDSHNWRTYLHLFDEYTDEEKDKYENVFKDFKARFTTNPNKRKEVSLIFPIYLFIYWSANQI